LFEVFQDTTEFYLKQDQISFTFIIFEVFCNAFIINEYKID